MLARRLRELEDAGIVESRPVARGRGREYRPTRAAEELREVLERLGEWGQRWGTTQFDPENLDVTLLMWNVRRRIDMERAARPPGGRPLRLPRLPAALPPPSDRWLILDRPEPDVCLKDPGFDVDLVVGADAGAMARVWTGAITFAQAVRSGGLRVDGRRDLVRAFPTWLLLSHFAHVERPARAG